MRREKQSIAMTAFLLFSLFSYFGWTAIFKTIGCLLRLLNF